MNMKKIITLIAVIVSLASCKKTLDVPPITDIDGNVYVDVSIGGQTWLKTNLTTTRYRNGDPIPKVTNTLDWASLTTGAYCYFNNDSATYAATYGKLYNWYAVNDPRGLAPVGWHIPGDLEWTTLTNYLNGDTLAAARMKEAGTSHWTPTNPDATNSSGFTALPGNIRGQAGDFSTPIGMKGYFWSSTPAVSISTWGRMLLHSTSNVTRAYYDRRLGFSVRCIKD